MTLHVLVSRKRVYFEQTRLCVQKDTSTHVASLARGEVIPTPRVLHDPSSTLNMYTTLCYLVSIQSAEFTFTI